MAQPELATQLLIDLRDAGPETVGQLFPIIYGELGLVARAQLRRERPNHTLDTSALVHEAYIRLIHESDVAWKDRAHFFGLAARAMRQILVDYARSRAALKRGGDRQRVTLSDDLGLGSGDDIASILSLDDALTTLERRSTRMARIVECRFFAGMTVEETAAAVDASVRTVEREWTRAKAHLRVMLE